MKALFPAHYQYQEPNKKFLDECLFAFDANVILNLFKYGSETGSAFLNLLSSLKERIWLPYQAALEYHRNYEERVSIQDQIFQRLQKLNVLQVYRDDLKKVTQHPYFDFQDAARQISQLITELDQKFKVASGTPKSNFKDNYQRIHERISELFNGKVGSEPSFDTLARWCKMGKVRYLLKQPPGFEDVGKRQNAFGDVIIWFQLMDQVKLMPSKKLILVTDDMKSDWWLRSANGLQPHPELLNEMHKVGAEFHLLLADKFLKLAKDFLPNATEETITKAVEEVRQVAEDGSVVQSDETSFMALDSVVYEPPPKHFINQMPPSKRFRVLAAINEAAENWLSDPRRQPGQITTLAIIESGFRISIRASVEGLTVWRIVRTHPNMLGAEPLGGGPFGGGPLGGGPFGGPML